METQEMEWKSVEPEVWKYEKEGDSIEGVLIDKREKGGKYNNESYYLENRNKSWVVFGTTVLENRMKLVHVGDVVKIVYKGIQKNKRDEDTKIFAVFKQKQADAVEITDEKVGEGEKPSSSGNASEQK